MIAPATGRGALGLPRVVNLRGCATLLGGSLMDAEVLAAFCDAASAFVLMDELAEQAGDVIAQVTGAEAGYVTSGAMAGLSLAAAACITGTSVQAMDRLPDASGLPHAILAQREHRNPYDRALWRVGASPLEVPGTEQAVSAALGPPVVAAYYAGHLEGVGLPFPRYVELAHAAGVPVIVDAALTLPPPENLRRWTALGADLTVFSGGKSIRGPQTTGFIAGSRDLLLSVALQHQDMDVLASTWSRRELLASGDLERPPQHGIGRGMKVGKEELAALVVALRRYTERDHKAERRQWDKRVRLLAEGIAAIDGLSTWVAETDSSGRPVPTVRVQVEPSFALTADLLVTRLAALDPRIAVDDSPIAAGQLVLDPENVDDDDLGYVIDSFAKLSG